MLLPVNAANWKEKIESNKSKNTVKEIALFAQATLCDRHKAFDCISHSIRSNSKNKLLLQGTWFATWVF